LNLDGKDNSPRHGIEFLEAIRDVAPATPVIGLSARRDWPDGQPKSFTEFVRKSQVRLNLPASFASMPSLMRLAAVDGC
jgi:hypothetical protein